MIQLLSEISIFIPLGYCRASIRKAYVMQPVTDASRFKVNPIPKWAVPLELIEWQPVYHQIGAEGEKGIGQDV